MNSNGQSTRARTTMIALIAIAAGAALAFLGWRQTPNQFFYSYLVAWIFWTGLSLGSLSLVLLHNLTGGAWGEAIRPQLRAAASVLPLMAVLFLPIALNPERIYEWADPYHAEHDAILAHKARYLNVESFQVRAVVYFVLWLALLALLAWQGRSNPAPDTPADRRFRRLSGQGVGIHGLAVTFASIDWMMSLEPHWFSTIYGVLVFASFGLGAFALAICVVADDDRRSRRLAEGHEMEIEDISPLARGTALHDLGKLLLGFVMLWAYLAFSQFFIIWSGNLPEEVVWYLKRIDGSWRWYAYALPLAHFAIPFVLLLGRKFKRDAAKLSAIAMLVLTAHWFDTVWMIEPAVHREAGATFIPWLDAALTVAIGGAWWIVFFVLLPNARRQSERRAEVRHG